MMKVIISLVLFLVLISGFSFSNISAQVSNNNLYLVEGTGFAVSEDMIKTSEIDLAILTKTQRGANTDFVIQDGFVSLNEDDFLLENISGTFLRDGKYIRINGSVESMVGEEAIISFFGRLIEKSSEASIYGFTGRITNNEDSFKIIYTSKLSSISDLVSDQPDPIIEEQETTIRILLGSSYQGGSSSYIGSSTQLRYFTQDRLAIEPGTTITFVNDDTVAHSIISGTENYNDRHNPFTPDNRISTEKILPGKSTTVTFTDAGFYRLYDPDYPWMRIVVYAFPNVDSIILGQGKSQN